MNLETLVLPLKTEDNAFRAGISRATQLVGSLIGFLGDTVTEAIAAEDAMAQLNAVIRSTGGVAGVTADQALQLASAFQKTTKFSDEVVLAGESMLLTFTSIGKKTFPLATQTMLDMSQALKQDVKASAIQLGKALNDPIRGMTALRRVGVQFTTDQEKMVKAMVETGDLMGAQTLILDELQREFGGSAEAAGQTFGGQLEILKNRLSDVKETIGGALIPILSVLVGHFSDKIMPAVEKFAEQVLPAFEAVSDWVFNKGVPALQEFGGEIKKAFDKGGLLGVADLILDEIDKLDWGKVSTALIDGISGIDWSQAGMDFTAFVKRVSESIGKAVKEFDWSGTGNALASGLNNFIAGALFDTDEAGLQEQVHAQVQGMMTTAHGDIEAGFNDINGTTFTNWDYIVQYWTNRSLEVQEIVRTWTSDTAASIGNWNVTTSNQITTWANNTVARFNSWNATTSASIANWAAGIVTSVGGAMANLRNTIDERLRDVAKTFYNRASGWANQAASGFRDNMRVITDAVKSVVDEINKILRRIMTVFNITINMPDMSGVGGASGSSNLGGGSSGSRRRERVGGEREASGGPVMAGQQYQVAEFYRPEVFIPSTNGRITPIDQLGGVQTVAISNWNGFDYSRLASEIIKASNNV